MRVDYENLTINKPQGKRTPALTVSFNELTRYIDIFKSGVDVRTPEEAVASWVASDYDEQQVLDVLHSIVVRFGGGHRIWGKYHKHWETAQHDINVALSEAHKQQHEYETYRLREILRGIKGLGGLSYSTKVLRFLSPNHVILDAILREEFAMKETDYDLFNDHCRRISAVLHVKPVDVESGLFALVQITNPNQRNKYWKEHK